jgi:TolB-like protein
MEPTPLNAIEPASPAERKARKKQRKVRSAWIAFVGRIVAQFVGSAATIVLGLILLHKYQPVASGTTATSALAASSGDNPVALATLRGHERENSVAVLPLRSFSRQPSDTDIAGTMTDLLAAALGDVPGLRVVSRTYEHSYGTSRAPADVTALPGARYVLEGSVAQADGLVRVIVRLVDTQRDEQVWASRYDRPVRNTIKMQDEIAAALVRDLKAAIFDREEGMLPTTWVEPVTDQLTRAIPLAK